MIRSMLFLLLVALAACSPSRQIAVSATDAQARAGTIARLATHIGSVSTQPDVVADAATIVIEAQRIEAAAEADLKNRDIDFAFHKQPDRSQRTEFEIGQCHAGSDTRPLDCRKCTNQIGIIRITAADTYPLVVMDQMR